jgi:8-oxo-dGTP pyrophosphatase MutT (NUDIX family)
MESSNLIQGAGALFYSKQTCRWLFLMRADGRYKNTWGFVGGKSEGTETPIQTLHREIAEEIGTEIPEIQKIIPIEKFTNNNFEYHSYVCVVDKEFIPVLNQEHKGYCWTEIDSWPKPLHPGVFSSLGVDAIKEKIATIVAVI